MANKQAIADNFWIFCLLLGLIVLSVDVFAIIQLSGIREQVMLNMTSYAKYFSYMIYLLCGNMAVIAVVTIFRKK